MSSVFCLHVYLLGYPCYCHWVFTYVMQFNKTLLKQGGKQLQVKLTIPWKHNVQIEYLALSVSKQIFFFDVFNCKLMILFSL